MRNFLDSNYLTHLQLGHCYRYYHTGSYCLGLHCKLARSASTVQVAQHTRADFVTVTNDYFTGDEPPGPGQAPTGRWVPLGAATQARGHRTGGSGPTMVAPWSHHGRAIVAP